MKSIEQLNKKIAVEDEYIIAIGASTGGTDAISKILSKLPVNCPGILIVQHMPAGFTALYADRLNTESNVRVREAVDGMRVGKGEAIVAAGDFHLRLQKDIFGYYVSSAHGEKVNGHIPSVDVLFESVAKYGRSKAIGVILTGMGGDGAKGLLQMRKAGAYTIGQDKKSCVVYGMPMVAFTSGAVEKQAPLSDIVGILLAYIRSKVK